MEIRSELQLTPDKILRTFLKTCKRTETVLYRIAFLLQKSYAGTKHLTRERNEIPFSYQDDIYFVDMLYAGISCRSDL
jgi:hypothetical protein